MKRTWEQITGQIIIIVGVRAGVREWVSKVRKDEYEKRLPEIVLSADFNCKESSSKVGSVIDFLSGTQS